LGARKLEGGQEEDFKSNTRKYAQSSTDRTPLTADYSEEIDEIELAGNSDGCAGFDAQLFAHLRRNWELHSQPNSLSTNWFLMRWQQMSARLSSYISEKVVRLEKNWNSYITMFLPTDMELAKK
jgi:general transcription factor 3C polypeptide 1